MSFPTPDEGPNQSEIFLAFRELQDVARNYIQAALPDEDDDYLETFCDFFLEFVIQEFRRQLGSADEALDQAAATIEQLASPDFVKKRFAEWKLVSGEQDVDHFTSGTPHKEVIRKHIAKILGDPGNNASMN